MSNNEIFFDSRNIKPRVGSEPLPAGQYVAAVTDAEVKDTSANNGSKGLNLTWEVLEGPEKGRRFWTFLNLWNVNQAAVEIAQGELSAICHATGVPVLRNPADLYHKPCRVQLIVQPARGNFKERNNAAGYEPLSGSAAPVAAPSNAPAPSAPASAPNATPRWSQAPAA